MDKHAIRLRNYRHQYIILRASKIILGVISLMTLYAMIDHHPKDFIYILALYYMGVFFSTMALLGGFQSVRCFYRLHDYILGHFLFLLLVLVTSLQFPRQIQSWLLYHSALAQGR